MNKKLKNSNAFSLAFAFVALWPTLLVIIYVFSLAISVGQSTASVDIQSALIQTMDWTTINILNLNQFNDWLLTNVIHITLGNYLISYSVTYCLFQMEWLVFIEMVKVIVNFMLILPRACSRAFGGFGDYE